MTRLTWTRLDELPKGTRLDRVLRMPSDDELPAGAKREFVATLFGLYREAHRPALREISDAIRRHGNLSGTASPETIRKMLRGISVPARWPTVEAVLIVLCELAGTDPDLERDYEDYSSSRRHDLENAWHRALDFPDEYWPEP